MLNEQQQAILNATEKRKAIVATPGSGKTFLLTHLIKKDTEVLDEANMVAITFTRNAAKELEERLDLIDVNTSQMFVGTIHSFCLMLLTDYATYIGWENDFLLFDQEDREDIQRAITGAYKLLPPGISFRKVMATNEYPRYKQDILKAYDKEMQSYNAIDLNMLIEKTIELMNTEIADSIVKEYKAFYVDEFQDTYKEQLGLFMAINPEWLTVIGDPDQSIYEWNKAKPEYLVKIESYFKDVKMFKLSKNYRSREEIIKSSNALIKNNKARIDNSMIPTRPLGEVRYLEVGNGLGQLEKISEIADGNTAIICRKNRTAEQIADFLIEKGLPVTVMLSSKDIFAREEVKGLITLLRATISKDDTYSLMRAMQFLFPEEKNEIRDIYNQTLIDGRPLSDALRASRIDLNGVLDIMYGYDIKTLNMDAYTAFTSLSTELDIYKVYSKYSRQGKIASLEEFRRVVKKWKIKRQAQMKSYTLQSFLMYCMLRDVQDKASSNSEGVKIMTVHGSKGLEFDKVIIPNVYEKEFPMTRNPNIEEERRLFYVAITRAKDSLYLIRPGERRPRKNILATEQSRFTKEMFE